MKPYLVTAPWYLRLFYSRHCIWEVPETEKILYLTFDDGPHPKVTPYVLNELAKYNAKATFFCIGKNIAAYPEIYRQILEAGHRTGNHTYHHLNSIKTTEKEWLADVKKASDLIDSTLFRPPYGRITRFQEKVLRESKPGFKTIMWSVLSGDFDTRLRGNDCTHYVLKNSKKGSVIVYHDSEKAWERLRQSLPEVLDYFSGRGYLFKSL
ncbi:MAG: polysaccharide deacetylase family protein [Bacteroidetes bacterium]|nr:polysaccharide deacetylase family protein [Bacteroidota bacterium]